MALTETPVEINASAEVDYENLGCEGCFLNPKEGASFKPCTVIDALRNTLSLPQFKIAFKLISQPNGEFARKNILTKPEEGDTPGAQSSRYLDVIDFMQRSPVLGNLISQSGIKGGRKYNFNADGLPLVCKTLTAGATLGSPRKQVSNGTRKSKPTSDKRKVPLSSTAARTKSAVLDLLTESSDYLEFVWDSGSSQGVFSRVNEVYGNLTDCKDIYSSDTNGRPYSKITHCVPAEQRELLRKHKQEVQVDGVETLTDLGDSGNEVWSDIAEYLSGGQQLPLLAKASLAELILIKNDLESYDLLPDGCPDTVYAKLRHVRIVINEILNVWDMGGSAAGRNSDPLPKVSRVDADWGDKANCKGVDPDLFFPERGASTRESKEVCRGCTVREECLEFALVSGEKFGIWGGLSERERRRIRRQRSQARKLEEAEEAIEA